MTDSLIGHSDFDSCIEIECFSKKRCKNLCAYHYNKSICDKIREYTCKYVDGEIQCARSQCRKGLCSFHYRQSLNEVHECARDRCEDVVYSDNLCKRHFMKYRARCVYGRCEETKIYCKKLCQLHYNQIYREKRKSPAENKIRNVFFEECHEEDDNEARKKRAKFT